MAISQVRAQINGTWYALTYNSSTGKYEANITANAVSSGQTGGYFPATVEATSSDGQTATLSGSTYPGLRLVVQDTVAPTLTVTAPANGLVTAAASITVSGTAVDTSGIQSVTVNGTAVTVGANGAFSTTVNLSGGSNTITIVATDTAGNATTETRAVTRATSGPALTITSPAAGALINAASVAVSGTVSDNVSPVSSVTVNGVAATITGSNWTATVNLSEGSNTLTAVATNQVGLSTTVTMEVTRDSTAPVLTVTAPTDNLITAADTVTVSGTVLDSHLSGLTVNGTAVTVSGGSWTTTVSLSAGSNTITVVATDTAGNSSTATRTVQRETLGPNLTITSPSDGYLTKETTVTVTGTVTANISPVKSVTVNGTAATITGNTYTATVSLAEGDNTITVTGANQVDLTTTETVSVTRDSTAPTIALTAPTAGQMVSNASFIVTGTVSDDRSGVSGVTVNGGAATVTGGTFSKEITLTEGTNAITAIATDEAGNTATATGSVLLDTIPPVLTVTNPAGDLITNNPSLTVTGTASDSGSGLENVTVNGQNAAVSGGNFSHDLALQEGQNTVTVTAVDRVGHTTTVARSVLLDTQKPALTLVSPPEGWLNTNRPTVIFQATDEAGGSGVDVASITVTLDGTKQTSGVTISGADIAFTPPADLSDGQHVITVTVKDRAGNTRGLSATYGIDTVPPELYIETQYMQHVVDDESITIAGHAFDLGSGVAQVTAAELSTVPDEYGRFEINLPLGIGENLFTVTVTDHAGLSTTKQIWILRLVTDRTQADVEHLKNLYMNYDSFYDWPQSEQEWFLQAACLRGSYDTNDLNRVGTAVEYIGQMLTQTGRVPNVSPKTNWMDTDIPTVSTTKTYLSNVSKIKAMVPFDTPNVPPDMEGFDFFEANNIEKILVISDRIFPLLERSYIYANEGFAGEF